MKLTGEQVQLELISLVGWTLEADGKAITKAWTLPDFDSVVDMFNQIVELSKNLDHHPEVCSSYSQLKVRLWTHDVLGLSSKDFQLAHAIDQLETRDESLQ
jgi:4a-hydroxytetrahydrobiopterin dehydratase